MTTDEREAAIKALRYAIANDPAIRAYPERAQAFGALDELELDQARARREEFYRRKWSP